MQQFRSGSVELGGFNSKTKSNATYICHHFKQPNNCQIQLSFFLGNITRTLKSNSINEWNAMYISHHFIQLHNRRICLESWLHARNARFFFQVSTKFLYFCHNLTNRPIRVCLEVNNHERIKIRKSYFWKDDRHRGWIRNKIYLINTFRQRIHFLFYCTLLCLIVQSWIKGWRQSHEIKVNRFFYGMFLRMMFCNILTRKVKIWFLGGRLCTRQQIQAF